MKKTIRHLIAGCDALAVIKPKEDVSISFEERNVLTPIYDGNGDLVAKKKYLVFRFPKTLKIDYKLSGFSADMILLNGYHIKESDQYCEVMIFNDQNLVWSLYGIEKIGLCKVALRETLCLRNGQLFPLYFNARGASQLTYNSIFLLLELPYILAYYFIIRIICKMNYNKVMKKGI